MGISVCIMQTICLVFLFLVQKYLAYKMYVTHGRNLGLVRFYTFCSRTDPPNQHKHGLQNVFNET